MKYNRKQIAVLLFILIFIGLFSFLYDFLGLRVVTLEARAQEIITECAEHEQPSSCYEKEVPKLLDQNLSFEEVFEVTAIIQNKDTSYTFCHVLAHNIAAKETAKDPSKWSEVLARAPTGMCSNGAIHGVFQEKYRTETLSPEQIDEIMPELREICMFDNTRTDSEQFNCYHALGHLTMYVTGADIHRAVSMCDSTEAKGRGDYTQSCYDGAFMQIFQPLSPEDIALVQHIAPIEKSEARSLCLEFEGKKRGSCQKESWPLYRSEILNYPEGVIGFCGAVDDKKEQMRCYRNMFYILVPQLEFDLNRISSMCRSFPYELTGQCFATAASRFPLTDYSFLSDGVALCEYAETEGFGDQCYEELLFHSSFNYVPDSEDFYAVCASLPTPWDTRCFNKEGETMLLYLDP